MITFFLIALTLGFAFASVYSAAMIEIHNMYWYGFLRPDELRVWDRRQRYYFIAAHITGVLAIVVMTV